MLNETSTTENPQGNGHNEVDTPTTTLTMMEVMQQLAPDAQSSLLRIAEALAAGAKLTPEQKAAEMAQWVEEQQRARLARVKPLSPEEQAQRAISEAWDGLPETKRLIDASNVNGLDAIEMLAMHTMSQLFTRQYLGKIHLYVESGLSDLYSNILDIIQTGINDLPAGYDSELIGKSRED